jgi:hypothetical protein
MGVEMGFARTGPACRLGGVVFEGRGLPMLAGGKSGTGTSSASSWAWRSLWAATLLAVGVGVESLEDQLDGGEFCVLWL